MKPLANWNQLACDEHHKCIFWSKKVHEIHIILGKTKFITISNTTLPEDNSLHSNLQLSSDYCDFLAIAPSLLEFLALATDTIQPFW